MTDQQLPPLGEVASDWMARMEAETGEPGFLIYAGSIRRSEEMVRLFERHGIKVVVTPWKRLVIAEGGGRGRINQSS